MLILTKKTVNLKKKNGGDSQNLRFFVTLGLKILRLFRFKVFFEADIVKG